MPHRLSLRNRDIIERSATGESLRSIALIHGISPTRVSQILDAHEPTMYIDEYRVGSAEILARHRRMTLAVQSLMADLEDIAAIIAKSGAAESLD